MVIWIERKILNAVLLIVDREKFKSVLDGKKNI